MRKITLLIGLALMSALSLKAVAGGIAAAPADQPVVPGEWHLSLAKALALAQETGIPVVGFWGNTGCSYCAAVIDQAVNTPAFTAWRQSRQLLMVTGEGKDGLAGNLYDWVRAAAGSDGETTYPYIRVYWIQKDGTVRVDTRFSGYPYRANAQTLIGKIESYVEGFHYAGRARLACTPGLEFEPGTGAYPLPLIREHGQSGVLTNTLTFARELEAGGVTNWSETVLWAEGETAKTVMVPNEGHFVGGTVSLTLSAAGEPDQTAVIAMVAGQPVSTANPRFVGEPFAFGEWTMDLAAATNRVATTNVTAYTLVLFTGALWCPYCIGFERDVFSTPAFKEFAQTNNIALVEIDNYKRDGSAPTLLRYDVYMGATNDTRNGHSGAGYLSRHGIAVADAEAVIARNMALQAAWTLPGATRIGYPTLLLLRKDGSIAGRFSGSYRLTDNTVIPGIQSFDLGINMLRLHELLALAQDPQEAGEERNGHPSMTADTLPARGSVTASLRAVDVKDVYLLQSAAGLRQSVTVSGPESATVHVAVLDAAGQTVQAQGGDLTNGVTVTAGIAGTGVVYAAVTASGEAVQGSNPNVTVRPYVIETRYGLVVAEAAQTLAVGPYAESGTFNTVLAAVSNAVYRFAAEGAVLAFPDGGFEALGNDLYRAVTDGDTALRLTEVSAGETFIWQLWNPGTVGFAPVAESVSEAATNVTLTVQRAGGSSGACSASVTLDAANTTATAGEDFTDVFGAEGIELVWADGETGPKTVSIPLLVDAGFEGDEVIALALAIKDGAATVAAGGAECRLTIFENDAPVVGRLAFAGQGAVFVNTSPLTIVAREGSLLTLGVERVEGASTEVSARVAATAGSVDPAALAWANNDRVPLKTTLVTLPLLAQTPKGVVTVTLIPDGGVQTVPGKAVLVVQLVPADAPFFAPETAAFSGQTRVAFDQTVPVLQTAGGRVSFTRRSGKLPRGITAKVDSAAGALRFMGVPQQTGDFTAVYQVSEIRAGKKIRGGALQVTITVAALETVNGASAGAVSAAEGAVIDPGTGRVAGTLKVSVTKTARLTAKYVGAGGTVSFSAKNWISCDENGTVTAEVFNRGCGLTVQVTREGQWSAVVTDPLYGEPLESTLAVSTWGVLNPATDYVGYYTVSLSPGMAAGGLAPTGYSYMTLSLPDTAARTGRATYAGKLADGTSYSGSSVLQPSESGEARLVVFNRKAKHALGALLAVSANADETYMTYPSAVSACGGVTPYWTFNSGYAETSFDIVLDICGGYYNSADSLADYYDLYAGAGPMELMAAGEVPESALYGAATALPRLPLSIDDSAIRLLPGNVNPTRARLTFTKATGLFRGSFTIPFLNGSGQHKNVAASYAGVLLPGWTGDCGCGDNEVELPEKPFGMGAYWFRDRVPVESGGKTVIKTVTRGNPIIMQKAAE